MNIRPHVAQNNERRGGSAIDLRANQLPTTKELITRDQRRRASFFSSLLIGGDSDVAISRQSDNQKDAQCIRAEVKGVDHDDPCCLPIAGGALIYRFR